MRLKLLSDKKAKVNYGLFIGLAISLVIAAALVPTVFETINDTDTTDWGDLTGGAGAEAIFQLLLLVFVAGIVIYMIRSSLD